VKAVFLQDWWTDTTPKACDDGRALWSAMTARRVDAIIFMLVFLLYLVTYIWKTKTKTIKLKLSEWMMRD